MDNEGLLLALWLLCGYFGPLIMVTAGLAANLAGAATMLKVVE